MNDKWPVFIINLDRSPERMERIKLLFPNENLIRVPAIDGNQWWDGTYDNMGRPRFTVEAIKRLKLRGIIGRDALDIYPWIPAEVACALSHIKVWQYIIDNNIQQAIVLEDDAEPTKYYSNSIQSSISNQLEMPCDADVIFLHGSDNIYGACKIDSKNRYKNGFGNTGYYITKTGAEIAIKAQLPMYFPCDMQWWARGFKNFGLHLNIPLPKIKKIQAYGMTNGIVDINPDNWTTTMTSYGSKPWKNIPYERERYYDYYKTETKTYRENCYS